MKPDVHISAVAIASLSLTNQLIAELVKSGALTNEQRSSIYDAAIADNGRIDAPVNAQAMRMLMMIRDDDTAL